MTDYLRVYDAGAIFAKVEKHISSTLLYAEDKLFAAYKKLENNNSAIYAVYVKDKLDKAQNVLNKWTTQDKIISGLCFAKHLTLERKPCTDKISIDGLVGYLSGDYSSNKWDDEYGCVNAIVTEDQTKLKKDINGLKFIGIGAGAKWPVGDQVQNQRYYFPNYGFTLVATVRIDSNTCK